MKLSLIKTASVIPLALVSVGMVAVLGLASWGCYPKKCDPAKDPLQCKCPPGPCGEYPTNTADAGDGGK